MEIQGNVKGFGAFSCFNAKTAQQGTPAIVGHDDLAGSLNALNPSMSHEGISQCRTKSAAHMRPSFAPVEAPSGQMPSFALQGLKIDAERRKELNPFRRRMKILFIFRDIAVIFQGIGNRDPQHPGQMVVTHPGFPEFHEDF